MRLPDSFQRRATRSPVYHPGQERKFVQKFNFTKPNKIVSALIQSNIHFQMTENEKHMIRKIKASQSQKRSSP